MKLHVLLDDRLLSRFRHLADACDLRPEHLLAGLAERAVAEWYRHGRLCEEKRHSLGDLAVTSKELQAAADRVRFLLPSSADSVAALLIPCKERL